MTSIENLQDVIKQINNLYINERKKHISQYYKNNNVTYSMISKYKLHDKVIENHLKGYSTIGIFSFEHNTKFICFDIDTKEHSRADTMHLINVLENEFNIARSDIHVSDSGNKGYHVEIFFNKSLGHKIVDNFYRLVLNECEFTKEQCELRPTYNQGLKLPLGTHRATQRTCWYVDNQTLKPIKNYAYILDIEQIDTTPITDVYDKSNPIVLQHTEADNFSNTLNTINLSTADTENNLEHIDSVLENNCLLYPNTRNDVTLMIAIYLKDSEGFSQQSTTDILTAIMLNTKRTKPDYIKSSNEFIIKETARIVQVVYVNDYKFNKRKKDVSITLEEINFILSIDKWHLKQMFFIHLIHSKRYSNNKGIYYMTYDTMERYGATTHRQRVKKYIEQLEDFIQVVSNNEIDSVRSLETGAIVKKPNKYKIKKIFNNSTDDQDSIIIKDCELSLELILQRFAERYEINLRKQLTRTELTKVRQATNK